MIVIGACRTAATRRPLETGTELSCWPKTTVAGTRTRARSAISTPWMPFDEHARERALGAVHPQGPAPARQLARVDVHADPARRPCG